MEAVQTHIKKKRETLFSGISGDMLKQVAAFVAHKAKVARMSEIALRAALAMEKTKELYLEGILYARLQEATTGLHKSFGKSFLKKYFRIKKFRFNTSAFTETMFEERDSEVEGIRKLLKPEVVSDKKNLEANETTRSTNTAIMHNELTRKMRNKSFTI